MSVRSRCTLSFSKIYRAKLLAAYASQMTALSVRTRDMVRVMGEDKAYANRRNSNHYETMRP